MTESENINKVVNQVDIWVVMVVMMTLRDAEAESQPATAVSHTEPQTQKHSGPILVKQALN